RTLSGVVTNDMYQPWRALVTIINLCLAGKHSGYKRPRAPVYLPTEESASGYLKFSFKNTKRVTKYQRYLAGDEEAVSDDDAPAPKLAKGATTKSTRKSKPQSSKTTLVAKPTASKTLKYSVS
ncbi:hypothetical protein Tco_0301793, partial [Tanacetum coccineum]